MSKIIVYTRAYNAEKTLCRTIESILSQTYSDFVYYLLDNASTDGTGEIINRYARQDRRIIPLRNEINSCGNEFYKVIRNYGDDAYACCLDADDEYYRSFLEEMIGFIERSGLDIAACGNDFIDSQTNRFLGARKLDEDLILEGKGFEDHFPEYYQFMRTVWGKVYSVPVLNKCNFSKMDSVSYGADTIFAVEAFRNANRVGILSRPLHKYYISMGSASYQFDNRRTASDRILFDTARDYLISKCGAVNDKNMKFLYAVYLHAIVDTLNVLLKAKMGMADKLSGFLDVFESRHTQELIKHPSFTGQKNQLFDQVALWILSNINCRSDIELSLAADIFAHMNVYTYRIIGWQDEWVFMLLVKIRDKMKEIGHPSNIDSNILSVAGKSPYLAGLSVDFLDCFRDIVFSILKNDEKEALGQIEEIISRDADIPDDYILDFLELALNLSAGLECRDEFVYFKKLKIFALIDLMKIDEAREELADWDEILPDDPDFKNIRERVGK